MPDIAFHISSETADANGHCPSGDRTRITLPIEPAIQVPNDAQPVAWLHNLAFTNSIANVAANDGSDTLVLGQGDSVVKFGRGTKVPFIGYKYTVVDGLGTPHSMAMIAPLTSEHGLHGSPYNVDSATTSDGTTNVNLNWAGVPSTLDGSSVVQVYAAINKCFSKALNSPVYAQQTRQDIVNATADTCAYDIVSAGITNKLSMLPLPGSTANGIIVPSSDITVTSTGTGVNIDALIYPLDNLISALGAHNFEFMSTAEINTWINAVLVTNGTTYSDAVSVFDGLGGTPTTPTGTASGRYDDWQLGGSVPYGTTTPSFTKITDVSVTCKIPIGSYELDGFARAVASNQMPMVMHIRS